MDQPFKKVEKVDLGYLSGGNLVRDNVNGVFSNDNILSSRLVELRNSRGVLILALNQQLLTGRLLSSNERLLIEGGSPVIEQNGLIINNGKLSGVLHSHIGR